MDAILERQCTGMWRLTSEGSWRMLHGESDEQAHRMGGIMELFASSCWATFAPGAKFSARLGDTIISGLVDEAGVLVGFNQRGGNPVMLRTVMERLVARSVRDDAVVSSRTSRREWASPEPASQAGQRRPTDTPVAPSELQQEAVEASDDIVISFEDSDDQLEEAPPTGQHAATTSSGITLTPDGSSAQSRSKSVAAGSGEPDAGVEFEIVFSESNTNESESDYEPTHIACTWGEVAAHIELLLEESADFVGRTVAANYWRDAISNDAEISEQLRVDALGRTEVRYPDREVDPALASALQEVQEAWIARCTRVIPDVANSLPGLGAEPWIHAAMQGAN